MYRSNPLTRGLAAAIDGLAALLFLIVAQIAAVISSDGLTRPGAHLTKVIFLFLFLLYSSTEVFFAATPGKLLLGLRIARQDGSPADFWTRLLRWSTKYYSLHIALIDTFFPGTILVYAGGLMSVFFVCGLLGAFNDDRLTFHDQWSGTAVWRRGNRVPPPLPPVYARATA